MCILFVYINNEPQDGGYQVIIANNRDEQFERPTKPAHRWTEQSKCIGSRDGMQGKEGGTWLGLSTDGKIASLLNIHLYNGPEPNKKGRGFLVSDYLKSESTAMEYIEPIMEQSGAYNPFNLIMMEKRNGTWELVYYSSDDKNSPFKIESGVAAFGNSVYNQPWQKVKNGAQEFESIVKQYGSKEKKNKLEQALLDFLNNPAPNLSDEVLNQQCKKYAPEYSSRRVLIRERQYGTRTNTLILVDRDGAGEYMERTLREPVDMDNFVWDTTRLAFNLS